MALNIINNKISKSLIIPLNMSITIKLTYYLAPKSINNGNIDFFFTKEKIFMVLYFFTPIFLF